VRPTLQIKMRKSAVLQSCLQLLGGSKGRGQGAVAQAVQQGIRGRQLLQVPLCGSEGNAMVCHNPSIACFSSP